MTKKTFTPKLNNEEQVALYMQALEHSLKKEIDALRAIIKESSPLINERIKWNAPSYYYEDDIVTFGPLARMNDKIMLVFHHPFVTSINSPILVGEYKDRRLVYFKDMSEIKNHEKEIQTIISQIVNAIKQQVKNIT